MGRLLQQIAQEDNLRAAFVRVKANRGAPGVDRKSVAAFERNLDVELASLRRKLLSQERYQPPSGRRVEIAKPDGGSRPLGIPTVGDRVVQQATLQTIGPLFEEVFEDCSFGFRPNRGPKAALAKVREKIAQGDRWVAEFDTEVVGLVRRWLKAEVVTSDGMRRSVHSGTPQGGVISPLLANVYLHRLDQEMQRAGFRFVRYADDFLVTANRRWKVRLADRLVRQILQDIGLGLNEAKSGVRNLNRDEIEFLGFRFYAGRFLRPRARALAAFKDRIRYSLAASGAWISRRWCGRSTRSSEAGATTSSGVTWQSLFEDLDKWIRMRVRSYVLGRPAQRSHVINRRLPTTMLHDRMGLVSLVALRHRNLSPAQGQLFG